MSHICVLSPEEIQEWKEKNVKPSCSDHDHVKKVDAMEMTHRGDYSPYARPIAEWVGPHHIKIINDWEWRKTMTESGDVVLNLVDRRTGPPRLRGAVALMYKVRLAKSGYERKR